MIILDDDDDTLDTGTGTGTLGTSPSSSPSSPTTTSQGGEPQSPVALKFPSAELDPVPYYPAPPPYQDPVSPTTPPRSPRFQLQNDSAQVLTHSPHNGNHAGQHVQHNIWSQPPSSHSQAHPHSSRYPLFQPQLHLQTQTEHWQTSTSSDHRLESEPLTPSQRQEFQRRTLNRFYSAFIIAWLIMIVWSAVLGGIEINSRRNGGAGFFVFGSNTNGVDPEDMSTVVYENDVTRKSGWSFPFHLPFNGSGEKNERCETSTITVTFTPTSSSTSLPLPIISTPSRLYPPSRPS